MRHVRFGVKTGAAVLVQISACAKKDGVTWIVRSPFVVRLAQSVSCALPPTVALVFQDIKERDALRQHVFKLVKMEADVRHLIHALASAAGSIRIAQHPCASRLVAMVGTVLLQINVLVQPIG